MAAAGSGKTEYLVDSALACDSEQAVLLSTYTENGCREIHRRVLGKAGRVPSNLAIMPWFTFLIRHGAKPYQNPIIGINKIRGLNFEHLTPQARRFPRSRTRVGTTSIAPTSCTGTTWPNSSCTAMTSRMAAYSVESRKFSRECTSTRFKTYPAATLRFSKELWRQVCQSHS